MTIKNIKKWQLIVLLVGIICLSTIIVILTVPHFMIKDFKQIVLLSYKEKYDEKNNICYGNYFSCHNVEIKYEGNVDSNQLGEYKVLYTFSYKDKEIVKEQIVKVVDKQAPVLEIKTEDLKYCPNGKLLPYDISAIDDYDGDISEQIKITADKEKLIFSIKDSSGNETKVFKDAKKIDDEPPVITLNGKKEIYIPVNGNYNEENAQATDNCDENLNITIESNLDLKKTGQYQITYKVKDSVGQEAQTTRTIYVYQNQNYSENSTKNIYLTFDDGPSAYTGKLLDILKKYNIKATFFVTNQVTSIGYEDMITRAYNEGHTIGLHSYSHSYSQIYQSVDAYFADLEKIQKKVEDLTGYKSMIVRFPGGSSNTISKNYDGQTHIMTNLSKALQAKGYRYFDWNVLSGDAGETTNTAQIVKNVINSLGNNQTYVVLQHDTKNYSVNAVEQIIEYGLAHGYTFKALSLTSPRVEHTIKN